jgi:hypothetical protein
VDDPCSVLRSEAPELVKPAASVGSKDWQRARKYRRGQPMLRKTSSAVQFCGSEIVHEPGGGIKKKL